MPASRRIRRTLFASAALLIAAGIVLAAGVMPSLGADKFPQATPRSAAASCGFMIVASVFAALVLAGTAGRKVWPGWRGRMLVGFVAILPLLFGLALADGAMAFQGHGPEIKTVSTLMFCCAGGEFLAGVLALVAAFLPAEERTAPDPARP